eukprot:6214386-Pleurochrysis_carterae.AAC.4
MTAPNVILIKNFWRRNEHHLLLSRYEARLPLPLLQTRKSYQGCIVRRLQALILKGVSASCRADGMVGRGRAGVASVVLWLADARAAS